MNGIIGCQESQVISSGIILKLSTADEFLLISFGTKFLCVTGRVLEWYYTYGSLKRWINV